jgi:Tfp pilus assembly protein PilF
MFESARRAVALDETDSEARMMLARAYMNSGQLDAAIAESRRAIQLNPHNADANNTLGGALSTASARYEEGIPWFERALQLNPSDPLHQLFASQLALAHLGAGRYDEAIRYAHDAIRRQSDFLDGMVALAASLGYQGRAEEARAAIEGREQDVASFIERHAVYAPKLKECLLEGLRRAGLVE